MIKLTDILREVLNESIVAYRGMPTALWDDDKDIEDNLNGWYVDKPLYFTQKKDIARQFAYKFQTDDELDAYAADNDGDFSDFGHGLNPNILTVKLNPKKVLRCRGDVHDKIYPHELIDRLDIDGSNEIYDDIEDFVKNNSRPDTRQELWTVYGGDFVENKFFKILKSHGYDCMIVDSEKGGELYIVLNRDIIKIVDREFIGNRDWT